MVEHIMEKWSVYLCDMGRSWQDKRCQYIYAGDNETLIKQKSNENKFFAEKTFKCDMEIHLGTKPSLLLIWQL